MKNIIDAVILAEGMPLLGGYLSQCAVGFSNQNKKDQKVCQFS